MSTLTDLINTSGDDAKEFINNEIDNDELEALLNSRRRTIKQFLNTEEIRTKARIEKITIGLIDHVLNNAMGRII